MCNVCLHLSVFMIFKMVELDRWTQMLLRKEIRRMVLERFKNRFWYQFGITMEEVNGDLRLLVLPRREIEQLSIYDKSFYYVIKYNFGRVFGDKLVKTFMTRNPKLFHSYAFGAKFSELNWFWVEEEIIPRMREIEEDIDKKHKIKMLDYGVKWFQHTE